MSKNIEYVQSEVVGSEIVETATDSSKLGDLITEAWATLYARSTGLKVVPQPAVHVETEVVELKALLLALLRAVWKTTCRLFNGHSLGEVFGAAVISNKSVDDAYEWLLARLTKSYLPTPSLPQPQDAPHLVENLQAGLGSRRISNGTDSNTPDGVSLLRLWGNTATKNTITKLIDDNIGWTWDNAYVLDYFIGAGYSRFTGLTEIVINASRITTYMSPRNNGFPNMVFRLPYVTYIYNGRLLGQDSNTSYASWGNNRIYFDSLEDTTNVNISTDTYATVPCGYIYLPSYKKGYWRVGGSAANYYDNRYTKYMLIGCKGDKTDTITLFCHTTANTTITDIEIGDKENIDKGLAPRWLPCQNLTIQNINGLTADNFKAHIAERLATVESGDANPPILSLSQTLYDMIRNAENLFIFDNETESRTIYDYITNVKHWTISLI